MSVAAAIIESMFDNSLLSLEAIGRLDNAGLVDTMHGAARQQSAWLARVFAAGAALYHRRLAERDIAEREIWAIDGWEAVAAEIAAAQGIGRHARPDNCASAWFWPTGCPSSVPCSLTAWWITRWSPRLCIAPS